MSATRRFGPTGKVATAMLAGLIGALSPSVPGVVSSTAWAQEDSGYYATPPPYDASLAAALPPDGPPKPDRAYSKEVNCVTRNLGENVVLQNKPWGQEYLQIDQVHKLMQAATGSIGAGVKVAVIDTGVYEHQFLQGRLEGGGDYVDPPFNGLEDCDGHGTEVAGIIAAKTPSHIGFRGVAPDAGVVSIRQSSQNYRPVTETPSAPPPSTPSAPAGPTGQPTSSAPPTAGAPNESAGEPPAGNGEPPANERPTSGQQTGGRQQEQEGTAGTVNALAQAVRHAADISGVKVITMSVDSCRPANGTYSTSERRLQAAIRYAVSVKDIVVVSAAGNKGENCEQNAQADPSKPRSIVTPPWFAEDVISVAAIDKSGGVADFSMWGPWVSVAAPGTDIISLDPAKGSDQLANQTIENNQAQFIQGTSFAAPYVAGLAALVRAKYPDLDARGVMNRITSTAQHPGAADGRDKFVGHGVINPVAALTAIIPAEEGVPPAATQQLPANLPPATHRNWIPVIVALSGTGAGLVLLLLTLFVTHTIRRKANSPTESG